MENKINIAELLKGCPKGMELYSTIYGTVYFEGVRNTGNAVLIDVKTSCNTEVQFYPDGKFNTYYSDSEITLFPSKNVRSWEGFVPPYKFKVGDRVKDKNNFVYTILSVESWGYMLNDLHRTCIGLDKQDNYELFLDKFDITTLKPFDKVLVRVCDTAKWFGDFYLWYDDTEKDFPYNCVGGTWSDCIPYESNEHLLGTTDNCDEYYKIWE